MVGAEIWIFLFSGIEDHGALWVRLLLAAHGARVAIAWTGRMAGRRQAVWKGGLAPIRA